MTGRGWESASTTRIGGALTEGRAEGKEEKLKFHNVGGLIGGIGGVGGVGGTGSPSPVVLAP